MKELDKQKESRVLRSQLRDLYEDCIDALNQGKPTDSIQVQILILRDRLYRLERSIEKNKAYEGLEEPDPSGYKISGKVIGICEYCEKEVIEGQKHPDPKEEGLFCNYYCRARNRKIRKALTSNRATNTIILKNNSTEVYHGF